MVRLAVESDIPRLLEMGKRFRRESSYSDVISENDAQFVNLGKQLIANGSLLVSEREGTITGMIGFILFDHFMSGEKVCGEVFWWVEPEFRGDGLRLLKEAEKKALAAGAKFMQMIAPTEGVATLYQRLGYKFVESAYQRAL